MTTYHRDRRVQKIEQKEGSTVLAGTFYTYGVAVNPTHGGPMEWTEMRTGSSPASQMYEIAWRDGAGRTVEAVNPGFTAEEHTHSWYYAGTDLLGKVSRPGMADTLHEYDEMATLFRTGLDLGGNGQLDLASSDRITEEVGSFVREEGLWWRQNLSKVYAEAGDDESTTVLTEKVQMQGAGCRYGPHQQRVEDVHGNVTQTTIEPDDGDMLVVRTVIHPDSSTPDPEQSVSRDGLVVFTRSKTGRQTTYAYDGLARRTSITDAQTGTSLIHYDAAGRVDWVEDAARGRTTYSYDASTGRLALEKNAADKYTRHAYTLLGQLWRTWGDVAYPVEYAYDAWGRMVQMKTYRDDPAQGAWTDASWPADPGVADVTAWAYQEATGLLTGKTDAAAKSVTYTYGAGGRLATRTWARGSGSVVTTYDYGPGTGELTSVTYPTGTPSVTNSYTRAGLLSTIEDGAGTRTYSYNSALQIEEETINAGGLFESSLTLGREYATDGFKGRYIGLDLTQGITPTGYDVSYGYDATGRLDSVASASIVLGGTLTFDYTYFERPQEDPDPPLATDLIRSIEETARLLKSTYGYAESCDLVTEVKNEAATTVVSQYNYTHDALGRRDSVSSQGEGISTSWTYDYEYNDRNELRLALATPSEEAARRREYQYDPIGNRAWSESGFPPARTTYDTDALNQYTKTTNPVDEFTYDDDGNLIEDATTTYTYDAENRLIKVEAPPRAVYEYDYMGRRVARKVGPDANPSSYTKYVYDGWRVIAELNGLAGDALIRTYTWGLDLSGTTEGAGGIGGLLAAEKLSAPTTALAYFYDANGNVGQLVRISDRAIGAKYEYDPYGNAVYTSTTSYTSWNTYRFSTKPLDTVPGLYYYGYRDYSPKLGRWITRDPLADRGNPGTKEHHERVDMLFLLEEALWRMLAADDDTSLSLRLVALENAEFWKGGSQTLRAGDPSVGLRWHDPDTALPLSVDALGTSGGLHPYTGYLNSAINHVDPDGKSPVVTGFIGGVIGGAVGALTAWRNDGDGWTVLKAGTRGFIVGGVSGLTIGWGGGTIAGVLGGGIAGGALSGGVAGATGALAGEVFDSTVARRCRVDWSNVVDAGVLGAVSGGLLSRPYTRDLQRVTTWAPRAVKPSVVTGRWVMIGGPTVGNWVRSGVPQLRYPFGNCLTTPPLPGSSLVYPGGALGNLKGIIGQRRLYMH